MPKKVHDLALELGLTDKALIEKLSDLDYGKKKAADELSDIDAIAVKNTIVNSRKKAETKIVKAATKKESAKVDGDVKVQIKAVDIAIIEAQAKKAQHSASSSAKEKAEPARAVQTPPVGKPLPKAPQAAAGAVSSLRPAPVGKPMPKNAVPQKKSDVPQDIEKLPVEPALDIKPEAVELPPVEMTQDVPSAEKVVAAVDDNVNEAAETAQENKEQLPETKKKKESKVKKPVDVEDKPADAEKDHTQDSKATEKQEDNIVTEKKESVKAEKTTVTEKKEPAAKAEPAGKEKTASKEKPASKEHAHEKAKRVEDKPAKPVKESAKAEEKPQEKKKPETPPVDYTPGIGLKIIRRAADEPKPEPRKPVEPKPREERKPRDYKGSQRPDGRKPEGNKDAATSQRRKPDASKKPGDPKDRVLVYSAPATGGHSADKKGRKDNKDKDKGKVKGKKEKFEAKPLDLTKTAPKKHRKYKDKNDIVETDVMEMQEPLPAGSVVINVPITVAGFCEQIEKTTSQAIMALMKMGIMANINQNLDEETAVLLGIELGVNVVVNKVMKEEVEEGLDIYVDKESDLQPRPPIITVMGHVDHGKTSLLDAIRKTNVTESEAGGITQHIGASEIELKGQRIVFLDTPGHEAFTAMRARGALVTDIAVLVVAADDSVKPQTIESISHAKAAGVPIIVAINKMDKPGANPDMVKKDLSDNGVLVEEWGGDVICVPVSAKTGEGIVQLLEMILLQAEVLELKANPDRLAMGTVIEARLDKAKGPVATLLITNGTLQSGNSIVVGTASGRIRVMTNYKGDIIRKAGPARAVEITGLTDVPQAGDEFYEVREDRIAREIAERRKEKLREEVMAKNASVTLEQLFSQIEEGEVKELNLIIKADVQGSVGALEQSLEKLHNENVKVRIIHSGVGTVTESDILLASTSKAVIIGFNVRPSSAVQSMADSEGVEIRTYRIIYEIIDDIEAAMKGMLDPVFKEVILGKVEVRSTFKVPGVGIIAGAYVLEGKVARNAGVRLVRDGIVIHEGTISSLKRFKDDAKEVAQGFECGIGIEKYNDIKEGDIIEAFKMEEVERK